MQEPSVLARLQQLLDLLHPGFAGKNGRENLLDFLLHGDSALREADLVQETDALLSRHGDAAFLVAVQVVHMNVPVDQLHQGGLAAAVAPDHRDFLAVPDLKIHVLQYGIRAVLHQRVSDLISHSLYPLPLPVLSSFPFGLRPFIRNFAQDLFPNIFFGSFRNLF